MDLQAKEVVEKKVYEDGKHEYASRGTGNAGLTLGIIGTALGAGALWGRGNGLFGLGGSNMPENVNINMTREALGLGNGTTSPTAFQAWEKSCDDAIALTNTIWGLKVGTMEQIGKAREQDVAEKFSLYKSQIDADFGLYKAGRDQFDVLNERLNNKFNELDKKVAVMEAIRPYQDAILKQDISGAFAGAINYTDRKTCRCIYGELVLPSTPTVTGYQSASPFGCNCNRQNAVTPTA